jgi:hypothetical protein
MKWPLDLYSSLLSFKNVWIFLPNKSFSNRFVFLKGEEGSWFVLHKWTTMFVMYFTHNLHGQFIAFDNIYMWKCIILTWSKLVLMAPSCGALSLCSFPLMQDLQRQKDLTLVKYNTISIFLKIMGCKHSWLTCHIFEFEQQH